MLKTSSLEQWSMGVTYKTDVNHCITALFVEMLDKQWVLNEQGGMYFFCLRVNDKNKIW